MGKGNEWRPSARTHGPARGHSCRGSKTLVPFVHGVRTDQVLTQGLGNLYGDSKARRERERMGPTMPKLKPSDIPGEADDFFERDWEEDDQR